MKSARTKVIRTDEPKDIMAEIVSLGGTVEYAGRALGLTPGEGRSMWREICADVGEPVLA